MEEGEIGVESGEAYVVGEGGVGFSGVVVGVVKAAGEYTEGEELAPGGGILGIGFCGLDELLDGGFGGSEACGVGGVDAGLDGRGAIEGVEECEDALGVGVAFLGAVEFGGELDGFGGGCLEELGEECVGLGGLIELDVEGGEADPVLGGEVGGGDLFELLCGRGEVAFFDEKYGAGAPLLGGGGLVLGDAVDVGAGAGEAALGVE